MGSEGIAVDIFVDQLARPMPCAAVDAQQPGQGESQPLDLKLCASWQQDSAAQWQRSARWRRRTGQDGQGGQPDQ